MTLVGDKVGAFEAALERLTHDQLEARLYDENPELWKGLKAETPDG
jgi:hypothetical protein